MYKIFFKGILFGFAIVFLSLCASCASSKTLHSFTKNSKQPKTAVIDSILAAQKIKDSLNARENFTNKSTPDSSNVADIDFLIASAEEFCQSDSFAEAHALLHKAIEEINEKSEQDENFTGAESYLDDIARIYTDLMPQEYSDSIPEDISLLVFQRQLSSSLDTLKLTPEDSTILKNLTCQKGVSYNVPIIFNDRVYRPLYFFAKGRKGPIDSWLTRAAYYLPFMQRMFSDSGLPSDLAYLPLIESGFNPIAYSRAKAAGIWQFIASTGMLYGLRMDYWLDERRDPIKSTASAARYLKKLYNQFGDWHTALASYNCGENCVSAACIKASSSNYWQLKLPRETMHYVPEYIAALVVAKNPQCFGFTPGQMDTFDLDTVLIDKCLNMQAIADSLGIDAKTLRSINPHILHWCTPPTTTQIHLYLPKNTKDRFVALYSLDPDAFNVAWYSYEVKSGQKLASIARFFKVPLEAIKSINALGPNAKVSAGQSVLIPIPLHMSTAEAAMITQDMLHDSPKHQLVSSAQTSQIRYRVRRGETVWELAKLFHTTAKSICALNNIPANQSLRAGEILLISTKNRTNKQPLQQPIPTAAGSSILKRMGDHVYEVQKGETLYSIAKKLGVSVSGLVMWNSLDNTNPVIRAGEKISYSIEPKRGLTQAQIDTVLYRVCKGDNLYSLAQSFSVSVNELIQVNNLSAFSPLRVGAVIRIPMSKRNS